MFNILISLLLSQAAAFGVPAVLPPCDCPSVSNLQKTAHTSTSVSYAWSALPDDSEVKVWYLRQEDQHQSAPAFTAGNSWDFTNLSTGHYTFYFLTICGEATSSLVGVEEIIVN